LINRSKLLASAGLLTLLAMSILVIIQSAFGQSTNISETMAQPPLSVFSTRINPSFDPTQLTQLINYAIAKFNRVQMSFNQNNYTIPLIGFSWISNTDWENAKNNAKANGPELAKFIIGLKKETNCPNTDIHIIAHSLGAAVVDSTLVNLDFYLDSKTSNNNSKMIKSVHLLGAAINNKLIANNTPFGNATEHIVENFYNLSNSQDNGLEFNRYFEKHDPLGLIGLPSEDYPVNYKQINVTSQIPALSDADGDGNIEECFEEYKPTLEKGDNHCGYIGFRAPFSPSLIDDGVANIIVGDWKNVSP
jgi:hypothetical protein